MPTVKNLSYLVFEVSDLDAWEHFAVDCVGMQIASRTTDKLSLRMDELSQRILLIRGDSDDLVAAGWDVGNADRLTSFEEKFRALGRDTKPGSPELAGLRCVDQLLAVKDPSGYDHELTVGQRREPGASGFTSSVLRGRGFRTGELGLGHILSVAEDYQKSQAFYREGLGLRLSDYMRPPLPGGGSMDAAFFHAETGRHHSLATAVFPASKRIHHFMVEYLSMDDVGYAYDRCTSNNIPIDLELGHHPNDNMFSFYARTPSGFSLEMGWGGTVIEDDNWSVTTYKEFSDWGHKANHHHDD